MADGSKSEGASPLWYAVGAFVLIGVMMAAIVSLKPLEFKPVPVAHCDGEACAHDGAAPAGAPEGVSHAAAPAEHPAEGAH